MRLGNGNTVGVLGSRMLINQAMSKGVKEKGSDTFVRKNITPDILRHATPEEKAHMLKQLMDGKTTAAEEKTMRMILESIGSRDEMKTVMSKAGGADKVYNELESQRDAFIDHLRSKGANGEKSILDMAMDFDPKKRRSDDFVAKYVDDDVLAHASPSQKAHMLKCLMEGKTGSRDEDAMLRILKSARGTPELQATIRMAGGTDEVLKELEAKNRGRFVDHLRRQGPAGLREIARLAGEQSTKSRISDDFVRNHVDQEVLKYASPDEKVTMLKHCLEGSTGKEDEEAIVRIIDSARSKKELRHMINGAGKNWLAKDVDNKEYRLAVETKIKEVEMMEVPRFKRIWESTSEASVDRSLMELQEFLRKEDKEAKTLADDFEHPFIRGKGADKSGNFKAFYKKRSKIVRDNLKQLEGWETLSKDEKVKLYNWIAHETNVELRHNINITGDGRRSMIELFAADLAATKLERDDPLAASFMHDLDWWVEREAQP